MQQGEGRPICSGLPSDFCWALLPPQWVTGTVSEKLRSSSLKSLMAACLCGFTVMYLSGMFYFYFLSNYVIHMPVTAGVVFVNCFLLTAGGDLLLCFLASLTARRLKPMMALLR